MSAAVDRITALRARLEGSSLRGATADGAITLDAHGGLVLDVGLVRRFDHYLSLIGEFTLDELRLLLQADLQRDHDARVAAAAIDAFDRYLGLRAELHAARLSDDLDTRFAQLQALRRKWFGTEADAMFGDEEAHTAYTLARRAVQQDARLDESARATRLAELDTQRSATERAAQRDATAVVLAEEQSRQFEQLGVDAATREAERRALWGEEAAQRLAALDREREFWDERVTDYIRERERIRNDARLDAHARMRALTDLQHRLFSPEELVRIQSLEAIGALRPGG